MTVRDTTQLSRVVMIGCGGMARSHLRQMLRQSDTTQIAACCEPVQANYEATAEMIKAAGQPIPPNNPDLAALLRAHPDLDAALIITPHANHHDQAKLCLESGLDVLLEKPMVMNAAEARSLIETRDRTGRVLVVAFQGSLSPQIRKAAAMLASGELGKLLNLNAMVWQNWNILTVGTWRQDYALSGGGFLFDTGAHMLNTVTDLAGEDFAEVAAWLDNRGRNVEILGVVIGRLRSGALVTMNGCGDTIPSCESDIRAFCEKAILRTGQWGERLEIQRAGEDTFTPIPVQPSMGVWEQFMAVRAGRIPNPSPPEIGLRMARLWDAIQRSAAQGGSPVAV
jgi:predicted dehydrogenase